MISHKRKIYMAYIWDNAALVSYKVFRKSYAQWRKIFDIRNIMLGTKQCIVVDLSD